MLHGIINEQGLYIDLTDGIVEKYDFLHVKMFKSLVFGAYILDLILIAD